MIARSLPVEDARVALIARLISDHRNAPNLWLARLIVQEMGMSDASAIRHMPVNSPTGYQPDWADARQHRAWPRNS